MRLHKFVVYVKDFEEFDSNDIKSILEQSNDVFVKAFPVNEIHIENWSDDHKLNQTRATQEDYDLYFKELK